MLPPYAFLTRLSTAISLAAADISTRQIFLRSVETFAKTQRSLMHSTRPLRATSASHPLLKKLTLLLTKFFRTLDFFLKPGMR